MSRALQMDSLRGLVGIRKKDKVPNARIRELCWVAKGVDERIDLDIFKEWNMIGLLQGYMWECMRVVA